MHESFSAFAIVELPRKPVGTDARQCCHAEQAARPSTVASRPAQVADDAAGIHWYAYKSGVGRHPSRGSKGRQVCTAGNPEFDAEPGSESGRRRGLVQTLWHRLQPTAVVVPSRLFRRPCRPGPWTTPPSVSETAKTRIRSQFNLGRRRCSSTPQIQTYWQWWLAN
jgi:hypothetical protein